MPEALLNILKLLLVALIYLFFLRVLRAVWTELREPKTATPTTSKTGRNKSPKGGVSSLRIVEPAASKGKTYALDDELTVGRAAGCQIAVDDTFASQLHARIFRKENQLFIEDLGSTNGTFLNRKKVTAPATIRSGDRIQIGRTVLEARR